MQMSRQALFIVNSSLHNRQSLTDMAIISLSFVIWFAWCKDAEYCFCYNQSSWSLISKQIPVKQYLCCVKPQLYFFINLKVLSVCLYYVIIINRTLSGGIVNSYQRIESGEVITIHLSHFRFIKQILEFDANCPPTILRYTDRSL